MSPVKTAKAPAPGFTPGGGHANGNGKGERAMGGLKTVKEPAPAFTSRNGNGISFRGGTTKSEPP